MEECVASGLCMNQTRDSIQVHSTSHELSHIAHGERQVELLPIYSLFFIPNIRCIRIIDSAMRTQNYRIDLPFFHRPAKQTEKRSQVLMHLSKSQSTAAVTLLSNSELESVKLAREL